MLRNFTFEEALDRIGNLGNLVWMVGASNLIDYERNHVVELQPDKGSLQSLADQLPLSAYIRPGLAFIHDDLGVSNKTRCEIHLNRYLTLLELSDLRIPSIIIGVGTHSPLLPNRSLSDGVPTDPSWATHRLANAADFHMNDEDAQFFRLMARRGHITVRGSFTADVLKAVGASSSPTGCPSLLLNPSPDLGISLESRYKALHSKQQLRLAINLPPFFEPRLARLFLSQLARYPGSAVIMQDLRCVEVLKKAQTELGITFQGDVKFFYRMDEWKDYVCQFDAVFGSRFHGSLMGIYCGIPVLIVPTDMRVKELADAMLIPTMLPFDPRVEDGNADARLLLSQASVDFNGKLFDLNRCRAAQEYSQIFKESAIFPSFIVERIAAACT